MSLTNKILGSLFYTAITLYSISGCRFNEPIEIYERPSNIKVTPKIEKEKYKKLEEKIETPEDRPRNWHQGLRTKYVLLNFDTNTF